MARELSSSVRQLHVQRRSCHHTCKIQFSRSCCRALSSSWSYNPWSSFFYCFWRHKDYILRSGSSFPFSKTGHLWLWFISGYQMAFLPEGRMVLLPEKCCSYLMTELKKDRTSNHSWSCRRQYLGCQLTLALDVVKSFCLLSFTYISGQNRANCHGCHGFHKSDEVRCRTGTWQAWIASRSSGCTARIACRQRCRLIGTCFCLGWGSLHLKSHDGTSPHGFCGQNSSAWCGW